MIYTYGFTPKKMTQILSLKRLVQRFEFAKTAKFGGWSSQGPMTKRLGSISLCGSTVPSQ